jgi:hypothetical protein
MGCSESQMDGQSGPLSGQDIGSLMASRGMHSSGAPGKDEYEKFELSLPFS